MKHLIKILPLACLSVLLSACTTGLHGNFIPNTYIDKNINPKGEAIGNVSGVSSQTWFLYVFPMGESPTTGKAINDAMNQRPGTKYLSNVSIDDREIWRIGYRKQTILIEAEARN